MLGSVGSRIGLAVLMALCLAMLMPAFCLSAFADPAAAPGSPIPGSEVARQTMLARATNPTCAAPWTYSVGLNRCICIREGYSLQWGQCLRMPGALPLPTAALDAGALKPKDAAARMEMIASAQDCFASLGLYHGLVDGQPGKTTAAAFQSFAERYGVTADAGLFSQAAQAAIGNACGDRTAALPERASPRR